MFQRSPHVAAPRALVPHDVEVREYRSSALAGGMATFFAILFAAAAMARVGGRFNHLDLRIVAHLVPIRLHPRLLSTMHPLVHLGDLGFVAAVALAAALVFHLRGNRRGWAMFLVLLSWPIEIGCKALLPQPQALGLIQDQVTLQDAFHGPGTGAVLSWLDHAAPGGVSEIVHHAGYVSLVTSSSFPSGSTARGCFVLGLLIWACLRIHAFGLGELLAIGMLCAMAILGFAVVLYAWHWPSDVLGGYLLGFCLLSLALAVVQRPVISYPEYPPADPYGRPRTVHSSLSPLPWVRNELMR